MKKVNIPPMKICSLIFFLIFFFIQICMAVTTTVPIGLDSLPNAISNASSGDILLLLDGNYGSSNQTETISKSLIIQADSRSVTPEINFGLIVDGDGISVMLRGLTFNTTVAAVDLQRAAEVNLFENRFETHISTSYYKAIEGDGGLTVIGNHFVSAYLYIYVPDAYIAGNVFESGTIVSEYPISIVGNDITAIGTSTKAISIITNDASRIIGNRIDLDCSGGSLSYSCASIYLQNNNASVISGNIISSIFLADKGLSSINLSSCEGTLISNNVVYCENGDSISEVYGIRNSSSDTVTGNIIYGFRRSYNYGASIVNITNRTTNNICFNGESCGTENGNLDTDPLFEDFINFRLSGSSPGINAGPINYKYSDLDRSRNDIGAYGGPWSIQQYDDQRAPGRTTPFIYPIFDSSYVAIGGQLKVKALGMARLQ